MSEFEKYIQKLKPQETPDRPIDRTMPPVLIVDDDADFVSLTIDALRRTGYPVKGIVVHPDTPYEAAETLVGTLTEGQTGNKVLIIDYSMGDLDIRQVLQKLPENMRIIVL